MTPTRIIGIDPGTHTGIADWDASTQRFTQIITLPVHRALAYVLEAIHTSPRPPVIFEDARQRTWFGHNVGRERLQGAGAAKRDATIWADFLEDHEVPHIARKPGAGSTGWNAEKFRHITKWEGRTSEHARDAGVLVYGLTAGEIASVIRSWSMSRAHPPAHTSARR